jgi:hypothetical protein
VPAKVTPLKVTTPLAAVRVSDPLEVTPKVPPVPLWIATATWVLLSVLTRLPY